MLLPRTPGSQNVGMAHTYRTLAASKVAIEAIGVDIARGGLPRDLSPFVFTFTGDGNVSQGAQEIFSQLPHRMVKPSDLKALVESKGESASCERDGHVVCCCPSHWPAQRARRPWLASCDGPSWAYTDYDRGVVYGTQIMDEDYIRPLDGGAQQIDRGHYRAHPQHYRSVFHEAVRPSRTFGRARACCRRSSIGV